MKAPNQPEVILPELGAIAAEVKNAIGAVAIAAESILMAQPVERRVLDTVGTFSIYGESYDTELVQYDHPGNRQILPGFPDQELNTISIRREELIPSEADVTPDLVINDGPTYVLAHLISPIDGVVFGSSADFDLGVATDARVIVSSPRPLPSGEFIPPAQHQITEQRLYREVKLGRFIAGYMDALAVAGNIAAAVDGIPQDDILETYRHLNDMTKELIVPKQEPTRIWEAAALPDLKKIYT